MGVAAALGEHAADRHRFPEKRVLLTGEPEVLRTPNGRTCFEASLRLLRSMTTQLTVHVPLNVPGLGEDIGATARQLEFASPIQFQERPTLSSFDAILSVGATGRSDLPWTTVNSDGWHAMVASGGGDLPATTSNTNPVAALFAASLGTAEVFKRLIALRESRGSLWPFLEFDLFSYDCTSETAGPAISPMLLNAVLVGGGTIGNGIVYLLRQLPFTGTLAIVDPQQYADENLGTSVLVGREALGQDKAEYLASRFQTGIAATGFVEDIETFDQRLGLEIQYPDVVLGAVDTIEARHAIQDLWLDVVIDGAIGDLLAGVGKHPWGPNIGCLRCVYREPRAHRADLLQSQMTGLSPERVVKGDELVTVEDVEGAPAEKRDRLAAYVGKRICSVVDEAMARTLTTDQTAPPAPSVPFVACMSAAMVVGELIKYAAGLNSVLEPQFQFDALQGPQGGLLYPQARHRDCVCTTRKKNIEAVRRRRILDARSRPTDVDLVV